MYANSIHRKESQLHMKRKFRLIYNLKGIQNKMKKEIVIFKIIIIMQFAWLLLVKNPIYGNRIMVNNVLFIYKNIDCRACLLCKSKT